MIAAGSGHADCIAALASLGADVDAATDCGVTALMLAAATGSTDCVVLLRTLGADMHAANQEGWTALRFAVHNLQPACIAALGYRNHILSPWRSAPRSS